MYQSAVTEPTIAPITVPIMGMTLSTAAPASPPRMATPIERQPVPERRLVIAVRARSLPQAMTVSTPSNKSVGQPMRSKPSPQAHKNAPSQMKTGPGKTGTTAPTSPKKIKT